MVLLYLFTTVIFVNCIYFLLFTKFSFYKTSENGPTENYPISLLVCAKNEEKNLKKNIPLWLNQEYPDFELVLINDASSDNTLEVMEHFASKDSRITIVNVQNIEAFWGNKKYALTLGIKKAKNKRMLFTDADCRPASIHWMRQMTDLFSSEKQLILGYGAYEKETGLLNKLIRFETLSTAVQYFSYAVAGIPYMGVGRNIAYSSNLFYGANGFMSHMKINSGDDDLFVNEVATRFNTAICSVDTSFTYSAPKRSLKSWFTQKKRHITTASSYKLKHKLLLGLFYTSNVLFWVLSLLTLLTIDWKIPTLLIGFRLLIFWFLVGKSAIKLKEKDLIPILPLLEFFLVFVQLSIFISNSIVKPTSWK